MVAASETFQSRWIDVVFVRHFDVGRRESGSRGGIDFFGRVAVQHEDLAEVRFGGPQQV